MTETEPAERQAPELSLPDTGGDTRSLPRARRRGRDGRLLDLQPLPVRARLA